MRDFGSYYLLFSIIIVLVMSILSFFAENSYGDGKGFNISESDILKALSKEKQDTNTLPTATLPTEEVKIPEENTGKTNTTQK